MENLLKVAAEHVEHNTPCALCTVVRASGSVPRHAGAKMLVDQHGNLIAGTVGGGEMENRVLAQAQDCITSGKSHLATYHLADPASGDAGVCGGTVDVFIEPLLTAPTLLVIGAGHVGRALIHLAKWSGFRVVVMDDRPEACTPGACPGADEYITAPLGDALSQVSLSPRTYVALVTRGVPLDVEAIPILLRAPVAYVGVIGSQRRWLTAVKALRELGISETALARIHTPIGLELGAETPEEIAVSIIAQVIGIRRGALT